MKTLNRIFQILAIVFSVGSLVLFFTRFVNITSGANEVGLVGAQLGFGSKITVAGTEYSFLLFAYGVGVGFQRAFL